MLKTLFALLGKSAATEGRRFWLGQVLSLVATVVAVYLAAAIGYDRALRYDLLRTMRERYHLLRALDAEVRDNLARVEAITAALERGESPEQTELEGFIWEAMVYAPQTTALPPTILTGTRRLYASVRQLLRGLESRQLHSDFVRNSLTATTGTYTEDVQPAVDAELTRLHGLLVERGMLEAYAFER